MLFESFNCLSYSKVPAADANNNDDDTTIDANNNGDDTTTDANNNGDDTTTDANNNGDDNNDGDNDNNVEDNNGDDNTADANNNGDDNNGDNNEGDNNNGDNGGTNERDSVGVIDSSTFACVFNMIDPTVRAKRFDGLKATGWTPVNKDEAAVFLAHAFHETDGLQTTREYCAPGMLF
ncbi:unnamed protein product [Rotaria sp. Silwood2]|nr:unnamed protein product [Rotaria sp. Silwood2]